MWSRKEYKQKARAVLKTTYWKALLVCVVLKAASLNISKSQWEKITGYVLNKLTDYELLPKLLICLTILFVVFLLTIVFKVLFSYPFEVGSSRYFLGASQNSSSLTQIGWAYKKTAFLSVMKAMLWRELFTILWGLLLIPLFVKIIAYSMVPYILADNPNIGYRRALELSICMTYGYKAKLFVLGLSMMGWILPFLVMLFVLAQLHSQNFLFIISWLQLIVVPYFSQVNAEVYLFLRRKAIKNKYTTAKELNLKF